jgi:hypothetical protein
MIVPKNRLKLSISYFILLHKYVYFLDLIMLWSITYFKDIKPKSRGIGSQTELSRQSMDHGTNRSRLLHLHRAYDPYEFYPIKDLQR